jgi:hypothetical protein
VKPFKRDAKSMNKIKTFEKKIPEMTFWDIFISSKFRKTVETILFHFSYLVKTSISFEDFLANKTLGKINSFRAIAFLGKTISKHQKTFIELHLRLLLLQIVLLKNITLRIEFPLENKSCLLGKYFQNNFNNQKKSNKFTKTKSWGTN